MKKTAGILSILLSILASAAALAQNTAQEPTLSSTLIFKVQNNPAASSLGTPEGSVGFKRLHTKLWNVGANGLSHPLCITKGAANAGWIGLVVSKGSTGALSCLTHKGDSALFWTIESRPGQNLIWMRSAADKPEPRATIVVATQHSPKRLLRPCISADSKKAFAGYISEDGKCLGRTSEGSSISESTYMVPVTHATGNHASPFQGWAPAMAGYIPHGALTVTTPDKLGNIPISGARAALTLCRINVGNVSWPGWIKGNNCHAFTYANNKTSNVQSSTFAVFRTVNFNEASSPPYAFNSTGGKPFYACVAWVTDRNIPLWGFTNNPNACTNGSQTSTKNVKLVRLPASQGERA